MQKADCHSFRSPFGFDCDIVQVNSALWEICGKTIVNFLLLCHRAAIIKLQRLHFFKIVRDHCVQGLCRSYSLIKKFMEQCTKLTFPDECSTWAQDTHEDRQTRVLYMCSSMCVLESFIHNPVRVCSGGTDIRLTLLVESLKPHSPLSYHHLFFILSRVPCSFSFNTARFTGTLQ